MAKVNVSVDTDTKSMSVELNGKTVDNITGVSIYEVCGCDNEKRFFVRLSTTTKDDTGVMSCTEHMMECSVEAAEASEYEKSEIDGFVKKPTLSAAQKLIREWLKR